MGLKNSPLDTLTLISIVIAFGFIIFTLINIWSFMPIEKTCQDEFTLINFCGCIPCIPEFINLFHIEKRCNNQFLNLYNPL